MAQGRRKPGTDAGDYLGEAVERVLAKDLGLGERVAGMRDKLESGPERGQLMAELEDAVRVELIAAIADEPRVLLGEAARDPAEDEAS